MAMSPSRDVTIYDNGKIWPGIASPVSEAMATSDGYVAALGAGHELTAQFPDATHVDLGGRTLIPGLIDAHNHAIRGGATWARELHWSVLRTRDEALASIREAATTTPEGTWISAVGGWHQTQFEGGWLPSRAELDAAAPRHPVYVQSLYEVGIANSRAIAAVDLGSAATRLPHLIAVDAAGEPTGTVIGLAAYNLFLTAVGAPTAEEQITGTRGMFREFAGLGLTGICDPGGFGMTPETYDAIYALWDRGQLDVRTRMYVSATDVGQEFEQIEGWVRHAHRGFGDAWLSVTGIGEIVHFGCHDFEGLEEFAITDDAAEELFRISCIVAARGWPMHIHAVMDESIDRILDCWERVNQTTPIDALRFSLAHGDRIGPRNIQRLKALNIGVELDARQVFRSAASQSVWGPESMRTVPRLADLLEAGITLGVGSDATRASSYNPWLSLWWLIAGRSLDGSSQRDARHLASREQALDLHTRGSAWFSFDEQVRGSLQPGMLSDFTVLSDDYFTVDVDAIPQLRSELTVAGDRITYSSGLLVDATAAL
jgi:predicted amidohydrolase YtcJ